MCVCVCLITVSVTFIYSFKFSVRSFLKAFHNDDFFKHGKQLRSKSSSSFQLYLLMAIKNTLYVSFSCCLKCISSALTLKNYSPSHRFSPLIVCRINSLVRQAPIVTYMSSIMSYVLISLLKDCIPVSYG